MKRILVLTALAATMAVAAITSPAGAGITVTDLTVAPDIGRPGDAFSVAGGGCGGSGNPEFSASVAVAFPAPTATMTTPEIGGNWSVGFVVPPGTPPGVYEVSASCLFSPQKMVTGRGAPGVPVPYISSTYTVIGDPAPAEAVLSAPRFTG